MIDPYRLNRRMLLAGLGSLATTRTGFAEDVPVSPVAHGILEKNSLALDFEKSPSALPDVQVVGPNGKRSIKELLGRTLLMPLWAEWCMPCLGEIPDFARLQAKFGNDRFAIIPILTGTRIQITPATLAGVLPSIHAEIFEPLIEDHYGDRLMQRMARMRSGEVAIPCNLLIAPNGNVVGREFGLRRDEEQEKQMKDVASAPGAKRDPYEILSRAEAGDTLSLWGKAPGEEFVTALANGFLE